MSQTYSELKNYFNSLYSRFARKEKFSLEKLISNLEEVLVVRMLPSSGVRAFKLVKWYYSELDVILQRYRMGKKSSRNPMRRKNLRKETAKEFFEILEKLGAIIPKWLSALPEGMKEDDFDKWEAETAKGENKGLLKYVKNAKQVACLRKNLLCIAEIVADTGANRKLKRLVMNKIESEASNDDTIQIGSPTIKNS